MTDYPNWFRAGGAEAAFTRHLLPLAGLPIRALQIGVFTGDASVWMLDNVLTHPQARLFDVDTWKGSDEPEHQQFDWSDVEQVYNSRTNDPRVWVHRMPSSEFWRDVAPGPADFDFIYIDGDHHALSVMCDGLHALDSLAPGGLLAFDDYQWGLSLPVPDRPRAAIDFLINVAGYEVLERDFQVWLRRPMDARDDGDSLSLGHSVRA